MDYEITIIVHGIESEEQADKLVDSLCDTVDTTGYQFEVLYRPDPPGWKEGGQRKSGKTEEVGT